MYIKINLVLNTFHYICTINFKCVYIVIDTVKSVERKPLKTLHLKIHLFGQYLYYL